MWTLAGVTLATLGYFGWKLTARNAYEAAKYTVIMADGACEVREYPDLMLATTAARFESQGQDGSFMRLFGFISGRNADEQKIAMTVPVFMERDTGNADSSMGLVVPKGVTESGIPAPTDEQVQINRRSGGRFAVIRFSGRLTDSSVDKNESLLRKWMGSQNLHGTDLAETAGYDPPWTPNPLRRNEVLIRLLDKGKIPAAS